MSHKKDCPWKDGFFRCFTRLTDKCVLADLTVTHLGVAVAGTPKLDCDFRFEYCPMCGAKQKANGEDDDIIDD